MKQGLGASGAPDGSGEMTCAQEITGITLVGGIVERQSEPSTEMTFALPVPDAFQEDGFDGIGDKARSRRQDLPTTAGLAQRSIRNRPASNSVENRYGVFEFDKVDHRDRYYSRLSQNDWSRSGKSI